MIRSAAGLVRWVVSHPLWAAGVAFMPLLLFWPLVFQTHAADYNPEDRWVRLILLSLPLTGSKVMIAILVAIVIALPVAIVVASRLRQSAQGQATLIGTLLAGTPALIWVYVVLATPLPRWLSGSEATVAASVAILCPLLLTFITALRSAYGHRVISHIRELGADRRSQVLFTLRIAGPDLLEAVRLSSLAGWSVVLFAETQVALQESQGLGTTLSLWSRSGVADFGRVAIGCLAVCCAGLLLAESLRGLGESLKASNELDR